MPMLPDGGWPSLPTCHASSSADALHTAVAAVHGIEYLLTWNMAHILNAELRPRIEATCRHEGI